MLEIKPSLMITLSPDTVLHSLPDQGWFFAFNVSTGDQFKLNQTSFWVLEAINNGIEWSRLRNDYIATFEVSEEQGEADLCTLLKELYEQAVIKHKEDV